MTDITPCVHVRRVYDHVEDAATRVLVDRLWPRGVTRNEAAVAVWAKHVAPTDALRRWYSHDPDRFDAFADRYRAELEDDDHYEALDQIVTLTRQGPIVLLTATRDLSRSHAAVLADVVRHLAYLTRP